MTDSPTSYREAVARIIDPLGYELFDEVVRVQSLPQGEQPVTQFLIDAAREAKGRSETALAKADAILALREEQPSEIERRLQLERDEALDRIEELERDAEIVSEEFEKDCWRAMRSLLEMVGWTDFSEGVTAEDAREIISDAYREALSASPVIKGGGLGASRAGSADGKRLPADAGASCPELDCEAVAECGSWCPPEEVAVLLVDPDYTDDNLIPLSTRRVFGPEGATILSSEAPPISPGVASACTPATDEPLPSPAKPLSAEGEGSALASLNDAKRLSADTVTSWRVKDYADGWIYFAKAEEALREIAAMGGALLEPVRPDNAARPAGEA